MDYNYITTTKGTGGRIKQLCKDFLVEEIGLDYKTTISYIPFEKKVEIDWNTFFETKENYDQLHLDLEKFNYSTTSAINEVSRFLRTSKKRIGYAGLKDKRAITVQRISIYEPTKERFSKFNFKNIKVYNPSWSNKKIDIGDLKQNKFTITIRQIKNHTREELQEIFLNFKNQINDSGIINYFGEQRFGGSRNITHRVGKLILQRNYKDAILLYLTETNPLENEEISKKRKELKTSLDFGKFAKDFPSRTGYESPILNYLSKHPEDYLGAFKVLPKAIQYLFVHAYQSHLFNEIVNERIKRGLLSQIDGDIVIDRNVMIPLFGFASQFSEGIAGEIEQQILKKEEITLNDFFNKDHSVFSSKGEYRALKVLVYDLELLEIENDDENKECVSLKFSFILDKGNYATNIARELIKPKEEYGWC